MKNSLALFFLLLLFSCSSKNNDRQKIEAIDSTVCTGQSTLITTNHQGEHILTDCSVFIDNDTLYIHFPAAPPAYWLGVMLHAKNGMFKAEVGGVPLAPNTEVTHQIKKQQLYLNKGNYTIGDTLRGYVDVVFEEQDKTHNQANEFYFKGCIYKIVREKDYQVFDDDEAIMSYNFDMALNELGNSLTELRLATSALDEFRIEVLRIIPPSDSIIVRELTWNTSDDAQISDAGIYRLTVWYAQEGDVWKPILFKRWNTNTRF